MVFSILLKRAFQSASTFRFHVTPNILSKSSKKPSSSDRLLDIISKMPKETNHVAAMQLQRQTKKIKKTKYPPVRAMIQVLGTGARGAPRSIYISTDQTSYQFNCGEGCQRLANEHKMKLSKMAHMFVTHNSWSNIGGLPGVTLTLQEMGIAQLSLYGPTSLDSLFPAMERFVILKHLNVSFCDTTGEGAFFSDDAMRIDYVPILSDTNTNSSRNPNPSLRDSSDFLDESSNSPKRARLEASEESSQSSALNAAISYVCRLHPKQGALLLEKCVEEGVPAGPFYGQLKAGKDVTLPCGKIVLADSVRTPDDPGPVFLIVDCPDESFLDNFIANEKLNKYRGSDSSETPEVVVHFTPIQLTECERYVDWMKGFPDTVQHMMLGEKLSEEQRDLGSIAVHRIQHKLQLLDRDIFPLLARDFPYENESNPRTGDKIVEARTLLTYHLRPNKGLVYDHVPSLTPKVYVQETEAVDGFQDKLQEMKLSLANMSPNKDLKYPKIIFFGTGSAIPNKTRNTSAILVEIKKDQFILLDCGEGTYGQIVRFFGYEKSRHVLCNLVGVFISHMHADHHIGLIGLLLGRQHSLARNQQPIVALLLIAPHQIKHYLHAYHRHFQPIQHLFQLILSTELLADNSAAENSQLIRKEFGLDSIVTTRVRHCSNSFGIALTTSDGFKFTYSGDTMPCENLLKIGQDSDLLIHEATMEDGMEQEAMEKTHSTMSQAIEAGRLMKAKFTLLTHFSQRYSRIPLFNNQLEVNVGVAFDNMVVTPDRLHLLPHFIEPLKLMFADHYEEMEIKVSKRKMRQERLKEEQETTQNL